MKYSYSIIILACNLHKNKHLRAYFINKKIKSLSKSVAIKILMFILF